MWKESAVLNAEFCNVHDFFLQGLNERGVSSFEYICY